MMRNLIMKDWDHIRHHLTVRFPHLTPADLMYTPGRESDLIWRLKRKTHLSDVELAKFMEDAAMATH